MAGVRSRRDIFVFFGLLIFTLFLIKFQLYDVDQISPAFGRTYNFLNELDVYCNQKSPVSGLEGNLESEGFSLNAVTVILRHGDRTPMAESSKKSSLCQVNKTVNKFVSKYWSCLHPDSIELLKPLTVQSEECKNAQLTSLGVKQHRNIGKFLRSKYRSLLSQKTLMLSTRYSRSLLSVLSMLSELSPSWCSAGLPFLNISDSIYFTSEDCPGIRILKSASPTITETDWPVDLAYIKKLFEVPDSREDNWNTLKNPESVSDFVVSNYCQSGILPKLCHADDNLRDREKHCVTFGDYNQFFSVQKSLFTQRGSHLNFQRASYLGAHSILIDNLITANQTQLSIFSGHDVSIEAFLSVLGLVRSDHVPYASRLIFEKWKAQFSSDVFFRILLNGEPIKLDFKIEKSGDFPTDKFHLIKMDYFIQFLSEKLNELFFVKNPFEENIFNTICSPSYIQNLLTNA